MGPRATTTMLNLAITVACLWLTPTLGQEEKKEPSAKEHEAARSQSVKNGLAYLATKQAKDGSWGKTHPIAVTSFACLAYLSASEEPFTGENGKALLKGLEYLLGQQKDGMFKQQGHSWIHGQGFATLAVSEAYGRSLRCKVKPDFDTKKWKNVVAQAVKLIGKHQSTSGGWWYHQGAPNNHEGSTTVCAVQALVSAKNYRIPIDADVLDKGFEYLKKCQTKQGGFNYRLGDGTNMKEGTAAAVATLGLMKRFDYSVMINGYNFLLKTTPQAIGRERFPYYGHFYGCMGMNLLYQEYKGDKTFETKTKGYIHGVEKDLLSWQAKNGSFPVKGWITNQENDSYATAFALIALQVTDGRLSIYNRKAPELD